MPQGTFTQTDIPEDQVDMVEALARANDPPPVSVSRALQPNGLFTVTAVFAAAMPAVVTSAGSGVAASVSSAAPVAGAVRGRFAIDSLDPVGTTMLRTAAGLFRRAPAYWGRYFHAPGQINASGNHDAGHYSAQEHALLRANNIRVLPIARQTAHISGDEATGAADAAKNVAALFEVFPPDYLNGADPDVLFFLDSEGDPSLTEAYYTGWSNAVIDAARQASNGRVRVLPAVYGSSGDRDTWASLARAIAGGATCAGLWVASWGPKSNPNPATPLDWNDTATQPAGTRLNPPVLAWQYSDKGSGFDTNQANPAHEDILLARLVLPPAP